MGRVTATTLPDNTTSHPSVVYTSYYPTGKVKARWGSQTNPTWYEYDAQNRLHILRTWQADPSLTQNTATIPSGSAATTWTYGAATGLLASKTDANNKSTDYEYTNAGRLQTRTWTRPISSANATRIKTTYVYTNGFLTGVNHNDGTPNVNITYDALGRQDMVSNGIASSAFTYDPYTLVLSQETITYTLPGLSSFTRVLNRSRDSLLRDIGWQLKNGTTVENQAAYGYSASDGRLSSVDDANNSFNYGYVANSNLIASVTGPVHTVTNTWEDHRDVLASKQNKVGTPVVSEYDYTVNSIGQRTNLGTSGSAFATAPTLTWGYDSLGQLTSADSSVNTQDRAYLYDTIGNRKKSANSLTLPDSDNYTANALNQYTAVGSLSPVYDDDGNATAYPVPASPSANSTLTWDAENRMVSSTVGTTNTTTTTYLYDSQSRRIAKTNNGTTTLFVYDGFNCIADYSIQNSTFNIQHSYLWGMDFSGTLQGAGGVGGLLAVNAGGMVSYPTYDGNGNVSEYLAANGDVSAHFEYDPFGNAVVNTDSTGVFNYRSSTKPLDIEIGLHYYTYRYCDPATGRWLSRDPIGEEGGVNLYGCVFNDPIMWTDTLGLKTCMGQARVLGGNPKTVGGKSGYPPGKVKEGTAAIDPAQWGGMSVVKGNLDQISGVITDSSGNTVGSFSGVSDVIGGDSPTKGVKNVRTALKKLNKGKLIIELVTGEDLGTQTITLEVPCNQPCPTGTNEIKTNGPE